MGKMKSLADKIREAVKQPVPTIPSNKLSHQTANGSIDNSKITNTRKEVKQSSNTSELDISRRINQLSFDGETKEPKQVPIRFPATLYSRLRLLGEEASIQKITVYAVNQLVESDEIKSKIKTILKNLNE